MVVEVSRIFLLTHSWLSILSTQFHLTSDCYEMNLMSSSVFRCVQCALRQRVLLRLLRIDVICSIIFPTIDSTKLSTSTENSQPTLVGVSLLNILLKITTELLSVSLQQPSTETDEFFVLLIKMKFLQQQASDEFSSCILWFILILPFFRISHLFFVRRFLICDAAE